MFSGLRAGGWKGLLAGAVKVFSSKRPERRWAAACFHLNLDDHPTSSDTGTKGTKYAKEVLDEIQRHIHYEKIAFGPTFHHPPQCRGSHPYASSVSDNEHLYLMMMLFALEPERSEWELQVFQTVIGDPAQQLEEWKRFLQSIDSILVDNLGAEGLVWNTT